MNEFVNRQWFHSGDQLESFPQKATEQSNKTICHDACKQMGEVVQIIDGLS